MNSKKTKVSILIVTNNKLKFTKLCIKSIIEFFSNIEYEIIVVDNNSEDGTREWLLNQSNIKVILNNENLGIYKAYNQAISEAIGENILFLQDSVIITPNAIENLLNCLSESKNVAAVSPLSNYDEYYQVLNVEINSFNDIVIFSNNFNISNKTKWEQRLKLTESCFLINREILSNLGCFNGEFFLGPFGFDDLCFRMLQEGYELVLCNDTFVYNYGNLWRSGTVNYEMVLKNEENKFKEKWGFSSLYSTAIRSDLIDLINENQNKDLNILEIGCACGGTLLKLKNVYKNANLFGIEIDKDAASIASLFCSVVNKNIEDRDLNYEEKFFDYIIIGDVLEHLYDPWKVLKNIKIYLKKEGSIITCIPNVAHYGVILGLLNGSWTYEESGILDRTHVRFFTLNEIKKMFEGAEFRNVEYYKKTLPISNEQNEIIKKLCELTNSSMEEQYNTFQYIIKAIN
ncbi:MAG: glycosyltransferase [Clostridiaceae bacterium]